MKIVTQILRGGDFRLTALSVVSCALMGLAGAARAQVLQLEVPFTDTGAGSTAAATVSLLGPLSLTLENNAGAPADFYGVAGSGIDGLNVALDFSTNSDFTIPSAIPNEGSPLGNGPIAIANSTALNYGAVGSFTASIWFKPQYAALPTNGTVTGPRIFILGANGTTDKAQANSIGLFYQQGNELEASVNTTVVAPTTGTTGPTIVGGQWYFYAITYDGTTINVYQGTETNAATLVGSLTASGLTVNLGTSTSAASTLQIGNRVSLARPFDGWINDFRFYTGTSTASQVEAVRESGAPPGDLGANQLANPLFDAGSSPIGWALGDSGSGNNTVVNANGTATYSGTDACPNNPSAFIISAYPPGNTNTGKMYGPFNTAGVAVASMSQTFPTAPTALWEAGTWAYTSSSDLMSGASEFYIAVNFLGAGGTLLASYESLPVTAEVACTGNGTFPVDTWVWLPVTNMMTVTGGVNTGNVSGTTQTGLLAAPAGATHVQFAATFYQNNYSGGSTYFDDAFLGFVSGPQPAVVTPVINPNEITLCTNTLMSWTAVSGSTVITNAVVTTITSSLGGSTLTTNTYGLASPALTVTGAGTSTADISFALTTNVIYNSVVLMVTDGNNVNAAAPAASFDTLQPVLVIETSDYNFNGGQFIDTPPDGGLGLYAGVAAGQYNIDFVKTGAANTLYYRTAAEPPNTVTIQPAAPASGGTGVEQKFVTAIAEGNTNFNQITEMEVGYNSTGDWLDYTRTYGPNGSAPAGTYNIYAYVATENTGIASSFYEINGDPTTQQQTTNFLGYIGTTSFSDNGWNTYKYAPLSDQFGNLKPVTIASGQQTLRNTMIGNFNMGFYMLMPYVPSSVPPALIYQYPDGIQPFEYTNRYVAIVGPGNGTPVDKSGLDLVLNGVDVTSAATITQTSGTNWTIVYPLAYNTSYSGGGVLTVSNTAGLKSTFLLSAFDTFNISNYQWEAVDYDYTVGEAFGATTPADQFIDNPVPTGDVTSTGQGFTGPSETNSYYEYPADVYGNEAQQGVDIGFGNFGQPANPYRVDTASAQPASDYVRPKFLAARAALGNPNIGPFNIGYYGGGAWVNYTRHYPAGNYNVWGRLAGAPPSFSGTLMSVVTNGVGTTMQSSNVLGSFADPNAGGYQAWHWIEMMSNGAPALVSLSGAATTLNVLSGGDINTEFFMLVPAVGTISASLSNGKVLVSFPTALGNSYQVYFSPSLSPVSWSPVGSPIAGTGATVTSTNPASGQQGYFMVGSQ